MVGHTGGERHRLAFAARAGAERRRETCLAGPTCSCSDRGVDQSPSVDMEHRDHGQQRVLERIPSPPLWWSRIGTQVAGAVAVDDPLGPVGGAGGVAHGRCLGAHREPGQSPPGFLGSDQLLVVDRVSGSPEVSVRPSPISTTKRTEGIRSPNVLGEQRQHAALAEDHLVVGVIDDESKIIGKSRHVEGVEYCALPGMAK